MAWDAAKPAGTDAANTLDTSIQANNTALDTFASGFSAGIAAGAPTYLKVGTNPAGTGAFRMPTGDSLASRNVTNTANILLIAADSSNLVTIPPNFTNNMRDF